jgi:hypothetical protein
MLKRKDQSFANVITVLEGMSLFFTGGAMLIPQSSEITLKMTRMKREKYKYHYKR